MGATLWTDNNAGENLISRAAECGHWDLAFWIHESGIQSINDAWRGANIMEEQAIQHNNIAALDKMSQLTEVNIKDYHFWRILQKESTEIADWIESKKLFHFLQPLDGYATVFENGNGKVWEWLKKRFPLIDKSRIDVELNCKNRKGWDTILQVGFRSVTIDVYDIFHQGTLEDLKYAVEIGAVDAKKSLKYTSSWSVNHCPWDEKNCTSNEEKWQEWILNNPVDD